MADPNLREASPDGGHKCVPRKEGSAAVLLSLGTIKSCILQFLQTYAGLKDVFLGWQERGQQCNWKAVKARVHSWRLCQDCIVYVAEAAVLKKF